LEDIEEERLVKMINMVNKKAACPPDFKGWIIFRLKIDLNKVNNYI
jgi:hypothetical protein